MRPLFLLLGSLALVGCSTPPIQVADLGAQRLAFDGFPPQAFEGIVYAHAAFDADHEDTFETDLVERGIVPLRVTMQLRGQGQDNAQILIEPSRMDPRLFLLDGTALRHVPADQVASSLEGESASLVRRHAFGGGLLSATPTVGYLFFSLPLSEEFEAHGRTVTRRVAGAARELDLAESLLTFEVTVDNTLRPLHVGIQR